MSFTSTLLKDTGLTWCILWVPLNQTLILDMNHDGDWFTKETWWFIDWFTIMIHITKMSVWFTGTHYSWFIMSSRYPWAKEKWRTSPTALTWEQKGRPRLQQRPSLSVPSKDTWRKMVPRLCLGYMSTLPPRKYVWVSYILRGLRGLITIWDTNTRHPCDRQWYLTHRLSYHNNWSCIHVVSSQDTAIANKAIQK